MIHEVQSDKVEIVSLLLLLRPPVLTYPFISKDQQGHLLAPRRVAVEDPFDSCSCPCPLLEVSCQINYMSDEL